MPGVRHLRSIIYALVLAPAVWILCGVGFDQDLTGRARDNGGIESLSGVLLLLLAGAAYAILLFAPISPAGPALAGLVFAVVGAWARIAPESYAAVWPANVAKEGFDVSTPGYGLASTYSSSVANGVIERVKRPPWLRSRAFPYERAGSTATP